MHFHCDVQDTSSSMGKGAFIVVVKKIVKECRNVKERKLVLIFKITIK